jgi:anti-sigma factor RsiW
MTQMLDEQLSAFLDGELPSGEHELLLARLDRDPACRRKLARYGLIGEALRGPVHTGSLNVAERVRASLDRPDAARIEGSRRMPAWAGWAVAGITAAAVLGGVGQLRPTERPTAVAAAASVPETRQITPSRARPLGASRMTNYLVYHSNYTTAPFRGTLDAHLVSAEVTDARWQQPARDGGYGR